VPSTRIEVVHQLSSHSSRPWVGSYGFFQWGNFLLTPRFMVLLTLPERLNGQVQAHLPRINFPDRHFVLVPSLVPPFIRDLCLLICCGKRSHSWWQMWIKVAKRCVHAIGNNHFVFPPNSNRVAYLFWQLNSNPSLFVPRSASKPCRFNLGANHPRLTLGSAYSFGVSHLISFNEPIRWRRPIRKSQRYANFYPTTTKTLWKCRLNRTQLRSALSRPLRL
jgi:hypothetical protein